MGPTTIWELPVPATAVEHDSPTLKFHTRRRLEIAISYRDADDNLKSAALQFDNVAAFKCTYLPALTTGMITAGYGRLVDLGASEWLANTRQSPPLEVRLRHLLICFDDGPCYEFLCESFAVTE